MQIECVVHYPETQDNVIEKLEAQVQALSALLSQGESAQSDL